MALKDLQHYIDHPEDTPTDPTELAELHALLIAGETGAADTPKDAETDSATASAGEAATPEKTDAAAAPAAKEDGAQEGEAPITSRDGKHTIPYVVLQSEREKRQAAESAVADLTAKLNDIQSQLSAGTKAGDRQAQESIEAAGELMSPEELEALREDFPAFGKVIDSLLTKITTLSTKVEDLTASESQREASAKRATVATVQELIDENPLLAHLQATDPEMFSRAVDLDNTLMKDPRFKDMATRFDRVAETMNNLYGPFPEYAPKTKADTKSEQTPSVSAAEMKAAVKAKVDAKPATPKSLSDLPAGDPPATDELQSLENASPAEIGAKLMAMSAEKRNAYLNSL